MRSSLLSWTSLCLAAAPLFAGCGGCGGSPSLDRMRQARGEWGVEEEEVAKAPAPARPQATKEAEPPEEVAAEPPEVEVAEDEPDIADTQPRPVVRPAESAEEPVAIASEDEPQAIANALPAEEPRTKPATRDDRLVPSDVGVSEAAPSDSEAPRDTEASLAGDIADSVDPQTAVVTEKMIATASGEESPASASSDDEEQAEAPGTSTLVSVLPQAKALAGAGKETEADRMLLGEAMLRDRLEDWPFRMRWSPALRRPAPWLRAGVAFTVTTVEVRGEDLGVVPAKNRALERDFGVVGRDVLNLGGELAERSLDRYLTLLRAGELGPTLAPHASGPVYGGRPFPVHLCGGLVAFGPGEDRLLKAHAERLGLDLLLVFDVRAKRNPDEPALPINDTAFRILDVAVDRELFSVPSLRNAEVFAARRNPVAPDPLDPIAKDIAAYVDGQLPLADFPSDVRPEHVRNRLPKVIDRALASQNALPYLVEIKSLYLQGYLAGLEARDAYVAILGEADGQALYSGSAQERLRALERLLPPLKPSAANGTAR